jgi:hypothetical protein
MIKPVLILLIIVPFVKTSAQTSSICNCQALVDIEFKNEIIVYDKPNGQVIKKLRQYFNDEDYLLLTIDKEAVNYFHVDLSYAINENNSTRGWIKKSSAIGTYATNYSPNDTLSLYSRPDLKSKVLSTIPGWTSRLYEITKCGNDWVYVKTVYKGQVKHGWLQPDKQCSNPYTTCN